MMPFIYFIGTQINLRNFAWRILMQGFQQEERER